MKQKIDRRCVRKFALFHVLLAACAALFLLYRCLVGLLPKDLTGCILHDWLFLYCPLCGGTRAVSYLLRFRFDRAFATNAYVALLAVAALIHYVLAWIRLLRGAHTLFRPRTWEWIAAGVLLLAFGVLRNVLMICAGFDPLGDLGGFWNGIAATCLY